MTREEAVGEMMDSIDGAVVALDIAVSEFKRRKPKQQGRWIKDSSGAEFCSECNQYPYDDGEYHITNWHSRYCPNCGAKMGTDNNEL